MASTTPRSNRSRRTWLTLGVVLVSVVGITAGLVYLSRSLAFARKPIVSVTVTSGNPVVRTGSSVTFSAIVESPEPGPVTLRLKSEMSIRSHPISDAALSDDGQQTRLVIPATQKTLTMTGDDKGAFHATLREATVDLDYRVEIGKTVSEWHHLTVLEPAEVSAFKGTVQPPGYAVAAREAEEVDSSQPISGLTNSHLKSRLVFTRPASDAFVEFVSQGANGFATRLPLEFKPPSDQADLSFTLARNGTLRIVTLVDEKGQKLQSVKEIPVLVHADAPPRFESIKGLPRRGGTIRPCEAFSIEATATDDLGLQNLWLESQLGVGAPPEVYPGSTREGERSTTVSRILRVPETLREGDIVKIRLRAVDSRVFPQANLRGQETTFPPGGWATFVVSRTAPSLERQEIDAQHTDLATALESARQAVDASLADVNVVLTDAGTGLLSTDQVVRLKNSEDRLQAATAEVHLVIASIDLAQELRPLATTVRTLAESTLASVSSSLNIAVSASAHRRVEQLEASNARLREAQAGLTSLREMNRRLMLHRRDRLALDTIASDQRQLGKRLRDESVDAPTATREQQALFDRVQTLVRESPPLRVAQEHLAAAEARRLIHEIESLIEAQRELGAAIEATRAEVLTAIRVPLVQSQREIADRLGGQARRLEVFGRLASLRVPTAEDVRRLAERLDRGEILEVLIEQEKLIQSLDSLSQTIDSWVVEQQDAKLAALQLARWQADLQTRLRDATRQAPLDKLPPEIREPLALEQAILKRSVERLPVPHEAGLRDRRTAAASTLGRAIALLARNAGDVDAILTEGVQSLTRLSEATPSNSARLRQSREHLEKVRLEQDAITAAVDMALHGVLRLPLPPVVAAKLMSLQDRQLKLAEIVNSLDLPRLASRQDRLVESLKLASEALGQAWAYDVLATQADVRRQLERLRLVIDGQQPSDESILKAAQEQQALASQIEAMPGEPAMGLREKWRTAQEAIAQPLASLVVPEAGTLLFEARDALRHAEMALRKGQMRGEILTRSRDAVRTLTQLANAVRGVESSHDRIRRLAELRRKEGPAMIAVTGSAVPSVADVDFRTRLQREIEELQATRVRTAQEIKGQVLERYTRAKTGGIASQSIADALDELATAVAADPTLAAQRAPEPAMEPGLAEDYLPSRSLAEIVRDLTQQQRTLRQSTTLLEGEARKQFTPGPADKLADVIRAQRLLARDAATAAEAPPLLAAAACVRRAADLLRLGRLIEAREECEAALRQWQGHETLPLPKGLVSRQEAILADLAKLPHPVATAIGQQRICLEELLLKADDLRSAAETAARLHSASTTEKSAFPLASLAMKNVGTAIHSLLTGLDHGMMISPVEPRVTTVVASLQKAQEGLDPIAKSRWQEPGIVVEVASRIRDVEVAMQTAMEKAAGTSEDRERSAEAVQDSLEKAQQAIRRVITSIAP